ncbi:unnamed protein product [Auanema sp. JU1783]|nr:unnamed protein product [Auanema sp. JU1783]
MSSGQNECSKIILKDKDGNHLISVDYFKNKNNAKYQFLTHAHKVDAITETWIKPIYCSRETAKILPTLTRGTSGTGVLTRFLRNLEVGQTLKLEKGLQVTVFDSNHCYGSVMYLFEGSKLEFSPVLCTGHFKADTHFFTRFDNSPQYEALKKSKIHTVYFDNRMINDDNFLSKSEVINGIVNLATRHPLAVCLLPVHHLGKEDILESISNTLNECVELYDTRFEVHQIRSGYESVPGNFVEPSVNSVRIRAIARNGVNLNDYLKNSSIANYIICDISHSELYETVTPSSNYSRFRYTEHSCRSEILKFLRSLRFENMIPVGSSLKPEDRTSILAEQTEKESVHTQLIDESTMFAPPALVPEPTIQLTKMESKPAVALTISDSISSTPDVIPQTASSPSKNQTAPPSDVPITLESSAQACISDPIHSSIPIPNNAHAQEPATSMTVSEQDTIHTSDTQPMPNHTNVLMPMVDHNSVPIPDETTLPITEQNSVNIHNHNAGPLPGHDVVHYDDNEYHNYYPQPSTSVPNGTAERESENTYYNNEYYNMEGHHGKPCLATWDANYSEEPSTQRPVIILSHDPIPSEQYYEAPKYYSTHPESGEHQEYVQLEEGEEIFITHDGIAEFFVPASESDMMHGENIVITEYVGEPSTSNLESIQHETNNFRIPELPEPAPKPKKKRIRIKRDDGLESVGEVVKANTKMLRLLEKIDREKAAEKNGESVLRRLSETENLNPSTRSIFRKEGTCIHNISYDGICVDCILPAFDVSVLSPRKRNALKATAPLECGVRKKRIPNPSLF